MSPPPEPLGRYAWSKSEDGLWRRDIDEVETFYASFCRSRQDPDFASFPVTCYASFTALNIDDIENRLRSAWTALRREHPSLSSWIQFNPERATWEKVFAPFSLEGSFTEKKWLSQTLKTLVLERTHWGGQWFNHGPPVYKLPALFLIRPTEKDIAEPWKGELYLRIPHDTIDGVGILHLLNRLLDLAIMDTHSGNDRIARLSDNEVSRLPLPLFGVTGLVGDCADQQKDSFGDLLSQNLNLQSCRGKPVQLRLPLGEPPGSPPACTQRASISLSKEISTSLLARCKNHSVTPTHAMSAAVVMALRDGRPIETKYPILRYSNQPVINLRHLCKPPFDPLAVGNYHIIAPNAIGIDVASQSRLAREAGECEVLSVAKQFRATYQSIRANMCESPDHYLTMARMMWHLYTPTESSLPRPPPTTAQVAISSLGNISAIVKDTHGPFELTDVWVSGEPLETGVSTFLQTWSGVMRVSMLFNSAVHTREAIDTILERILKHLVDASNSEQAELYM